MAIRFLSGREIKNIKFYNKKQNFESCIQTAIPFLQRNTES